MSTTPKLGVSLVATNALQKEIVINEALIVYDALIARVAIDIANDPPASPADGDVHIVGTAPTGAFTGYANYIAFYYSGWRLVAAPEHLQFYVTSESSWYQFSGGVWAAIPAGTVAVLNDLTNVNTGTPADGEVLTYDAGTSKWIAHALTLVTSLSALSDVNVTGITDGQGIAWNETEGKFEPRTFALTGGATTLGGLTDVDASSETNGYVLTWNTTEGKAKFEAIPTPSLELENLSDVTITAPEAGYVLTYNGAGQWVAEATTEGTVTIDDGTTTVAGVSNILVVGGTVTSPAAGHATITFSAGSGVNYGGTPVTSLVAGTNITLTLASGALTIAAAGGGGGGGGGGGSSTLSGLTDVEATGAHSPTDAQALVWSAADSKWVPGVVSGNMAYTGPAAHRYWRAGLAASASNYTSVAEFKFYLGSTPMTRSFTATGSWPSQWYDNDDTTNAEPGTFGGQIFETFDFGVPVAFDGFGIYEVDAGFMNSLCPDIRTIQYSDDGSTWTTVPHTQVGGWASGTETKFTLAVANEIFGLPLDQAPAGHANDLLALNGTADGLVFVPQPAISNLVDVEATAGHAPTDGQALVWSNADSKWKPGTVSVTGGSGLGNGRRIWGLVDLSTGTKIAGEGFSITKIAGTTSQCTVTFDTPLTDANYAVVWGGADEGAAWGTVPMLLNEGALSASGFVCWATFQTGAEAPGHRMSFEVIHQSLFPSGTVPLPNLETVVGNALAKVAATNSANLNGGASIDIIENMGGLVAISFTANTLNGAGSPAVGSTYTVPEGCVAVCYGGRTDDGMYPTVGGFYNHRLYNVTQGHIAMGWTQSTQQRPDGWNISHSGVVRSTVGGNPNNTTFPIVGVAGDVLQAQAWTSGDGNYRVQTGDYYLAIVDATTGELRPVTGGGGGGGDYSLLKSFTAVGTETEIDFTSIPQGYSDLIVVAKLGASVNQEVTIFVNGDTSAIYNTYRQYAGSGSGFNQSLNTSGFTPEFLEASSIANLFTTGEMTFVDYSDTDNYKQFHARTFLQGGSMPNGVLVSETGMYAATAAITSLSFQLASGGTFTAGSKIRLYGRR